MIARAAYQNGCTAALVAFQLTDKLAEWNWELTGRPVKRDAIQADNGRRAYGTQFTEPGRQNRSVGQAFDALNSTKPCDFLNEANQGLIGATGGG